MRVVTRHTVEEQARDAWLEQAEVAISACAGQPGFLEAEVCAAVDDANLYLITLRFESVGAYRRALSSFEVKLNAVPLLYGAMDEPTAFEVLRLQDAGDVQRFQSARAFDADVVGIGNAAAAEVEGRHS